MSIEANLRDGYKESKILLDDSGIEYFVNNNKKLDFSMANYSTNFLEVFQSDDYPKIYETARKNYDYDLLLGDLSILQFSYLMENHELQKVRYAFYEPPIKVEAYEDFLVKHGLDVDEIGDFFYEEWQQTVYEAELKRSVTPIRYDFDLSLYKGLEHAISHLHIGHDNEIRIPVHSIMSPRAFIAFIIRNVYFDKWKALIKQEDYIKRYACLKSHCKPLKVIHFNGEEKKDFYIV
jgi:hypothetical protein